MDTIPQRAHKDWRAFFRTHWLGHFALAVPSGLFVAGLSWYFQGDESSATIQSVSYGLIAIVLILVAAYPYFLAVAPYRIFRDEAENTIQRLKGYERWKKRIDNAEWDWNRFKKTSAAREIVREMADVAKSDGGPPFEGGP